MHWLDRSQRICLFKGIVHLKIYVTSLLTCGTVLEVHHVPPGGQCAVRLPWAAGYAAALLATSLCCPVIMTFPYFSHLTQISVD